tara:strand:+ start:515 stop:904 length:390 start_codon:yes stop_codon:yes gene_type:complete
MCIKTKKAEQLGMNPSTASHRLKKNLLFNLSERLDINWCYQCGAEITSSEEMTIEHKEPWLDSNNPKDNFFNIDNIAFSHPSCNYSASRGRGITKPCPSVAAYRAGCRCSGCKKAKSEYRKKRRAMLTS